MTCDRCGVELQLGMYPFCKGRQADHGTVYSKSAVFPLELRHVAPDGKPVVVNSLHELRSLERSMGVALTAFQNDASNVDYNLKGDLPKYRGEEAEVRREFERRYRR